MMNWLFDLFDPCPYGRDGRHRWHWNYLSGGYSCAHCCKRRA